MPPADASRALRLLRVERPWCGVGLWRSPSACRPSTGPLMRSRSPSPFIRFCYGTVAVGVLASCERGPTAADVQPDHRRPGAIAPSSPSLAYTPIGTFSVGGVNASGSTTDRSTPGPTLPNKRLLYRVTATGTVTVSRTAYWNNGPTTPGEGAYGPSGYAGSGPMGTTCHAFLYVGSTSTYGGEIWYAPSCLGVHRRSRTAQAVTSTWRERPRSIASPRPAADNGTVRHRRSATARASAGRTMGRP